MSIDAALARSDEPPVGRSSEAVDPVASDRSSARRPASTQPSLTTTTRAAAHDEERLDLSPSVLKSAIEPAEAGPRIARGAFGARPATPQEKLDRAFQAAQIEGCLGDGAL